MFTTTANRRMIACVLLVATLLASEAMALPPTTEPAAPAGERRRVYRFLEAYQRLEKSDRTRGHLELILAPAEGGEPALFKVPNTSADGRTYSPPPQAVKMIDQIEIGSLLEAKPGGEGQVGGLAPYTPRAGEDTSRGYVFSRMDRRRVGEWEYIALHLTKFGQPYEVLIPNRTRPGGERRPDARMWGVARRLRAGDVVMVWENRFGQFAFADDLHPYTPTRRATFVRIDPPANESAAAVRVKLDVPPRVGAQGERVEEVIPLPRISHDGRPLTDAFAMIPPAAAVPGRAIEFTTRDEDGVAVLSELRLAGTVRWRRRDLVELQAGSAGLTLFRVRGDRKWNVNAHTYGRGGADDVPTSLKLGLVRILDRPEEQAKLNLAPPVLEALRPLRSDGVLVSEAQQASWEAAAAAWSTATDRASRDAIEQDLLGSILDLADRQRASDEARITGVRSLVSAEQFDQICELGRRMTR